MKNNLINREKNNYFLNTILLLFYLIDLLYKKNFRIKK
jgi:hypothetical protein